MTANPLRSVENYSYFVAELVDQPEVEHSTVAIWPESIYTGTAEGEIIFRSGIRLRIREELDFDEAVITAYGYEVYRNGERLYWYDDFPHLNDPDLASTFPHHKHVPPDIKHNRIPAPEMSFNKPNLPALIQEIKHLKEL